MQPSPPPGAGAFPSPQNIPSTLSVVGPVSAAPTPPHPQDTLTCLRLREPVFCGQRTRGSPTVQTPASGFRRERVFEGRRAVVSGSTRAALHCVQRPLSVSPLVGGWAVGLWPVGLFGVSLL